MIIHMQPKQFEAVVLNEEEANVLYKFLATMDDVELEDKWKFSEAELNSLRNMYSALYDKKEN